MYQILHIFCYGRIILYIKYYIKIFKTLSPNNWREIKISFISIRLILKSFYLNCNTILILNFCYKKKKNLSPNKDVVEQKTIN